MTQKILFSLIIFLIILSGYFILNEKKDSMVCFEEDCFSVEIADEEIERNKGLMFREELDKDRGVLFIFENSGTYPFWMKNTPLPLDIIWIDNNYKVVHIANNTTPYSTDIINPAVEAKYVLEINGGLSHYLGFEVGSISEFRGIDE